MNIQERFENLDRHIANGTLTRRDWGDGEKRACLLLAVAPEIRSDGYDDGEPRFYSHRCPAEVLPGWLARVTPDMDDCGSLEAWPAFIRRYADVVRRGAEALDDEGWARVERRVRVRIAEAGRERELAHGGVSKEALRLVDDAIARLKAGEPYASLECESQRLADRGFEVVAAALYDSESPVRSGCVYLGGTTSLESQAVWDRLNTIILDEIEKETNR